MTNSQAVFGFTNDYFKNGNVSKQMMTGSYSNEFSKKRNPEYNFYYDKSNRLKEAEVKGSEGGPNPDPDPFVYDAYKLINTYDGDGNLTTLMRRDSGGAIADTFTYNYYSGTNKLRRVQGSQTQFRYDGNGNLTKDSLNENTYITYDHRNLITQFRHEEGMSGSVGVPALTTQWQLINDEVYSRGVNGQENCIYVNGSVEQWNVFGADNTLAINASGSPTGSDLTFFL